MDRQTRFYSTVGALAWTLLVLFLGAALDAAYEQGRTQEPVVLNYTETHNHYLVEVDAPVTVDVAGSYNSAAVTVNVPDHIEVLPIDPMNRPWNPDISAIDWTTKDPYQYDLTEFLYQGELFDEFLDRELARTTTRWTYPNQVIEPSQLFGRTLYSYWCDDFQGAFTAVTHIYTKTLVEGYDMPGQFVDLKSLCDGTVYSVSLVEMGVTQSPSGRWESTNRLLLAPLN